MTVLTYNPAKNMRLEYSHRITVGPKNRDFRMPKKLSVLLVVATAIVAALYFREIFFFAAANQQVMGLKTQNQELLHVNQTLKEKLSKFENLNNLALLAENLNLTKPSRLIYPQETLLSRR